MSSKRNNLFRNTSVFVMFWLLILSFAGFVFAQDKGLENLKQTGQAFRSVAKKVSPAVVFIKVEKDVSSQGPTEFNSPYGSLILEIDRQRITSIKQAKTLLNTKKKTHFFLVRQGQGTRHIAIKSE